MSSVNEKISGRVMKIQQGAAFIAKDLGRYGRPAVINHALSELLRQGKIRRIGRGVYYRPRVSSVLGVEVPPSSNEVAGALARQTDSRLLPSGAAAANCLGLSTQIPAKAVFLTNWPSRRGRLGKLEIHMKHTSPKYFRPQHEISSLVCIALRYIGQPRIDAQMIAALKRNLTDRHLRA